MKRWRYLWRAFHYRWRVNRPEIAFLSSRVRPGDTVVDVGCHKGGFLYWLRRHVAAAGQVYGFEPQPPLARYLKEIVAMQRWSNVTIEAAGLSSASGSMELFVPGPEGASSPGATLSPAEPDQPHHNVRVPVVTLDEYVESRGASRITFIKCDCEGHEMQVFRGAERLLRRDRPVLLFECERRHLRDSTPQAVFDYLQSLGYRGYFFGPDGLMPLSGFRLETHQPAREGRYWDAPDYFNNFAFLPGGSTSVTGDKR
ncbi:MAG TPA: FkbM family methyltransferase [Burkholderiales bacterium]|jgi:FkbM family methyltransferase|nr:FkbM family methyltransferase [Burkholderiales bacterium]